MARGVIAQLESELSQERSYLRSITAEQKRLSKERSEILLELRRTESVSKFSNSVNDLNGF